MGWVMDYKELLLERINNKSVDIGIIGLGYVGLPLGLEFSERNFHVIGFDLDSAKVNKLNNGESYIKHIPSERISHVILSNKFEATDNFHRLPDVDIIIICVPTPLNEHREPDMTFIENSAKIISENLTEGQLVILESSTYPGTTEEIILPLLENAKRKSKQLAKYQTESILTDEKYSGIGEDIISEVRFNYQNETEVANDKLVVGRDFFLAFSPEREDPNNPDFCTATIPKVIGGMTPDCLEIATAIYNKVIVKTVPVSSPRVAEATKLLENIYRAVNIALVNELKMVFTKMDIDVWEVIEAAKTKPFGFNAFYPGPGLGGHCIPIDPFYLTWKAREFDINTKFIELAGEINTYQPYYVVERMYEQLNKFQKTLRGSKILILGVAYKKNVDDMRESPSLKIIDILRKNGAAVDYSDPYVPVLPVTRKYNFQMHSVELNEENLKKYDLVLLSTNHDNFDYDFIYEHAAQIVDTRNAFQKHGISNAKLVKA